MEALYFDPPHIPRPQSGGCTEDVSYHELDAILHRHGFEDGPTPDFLGHVWERSGNGITYRVFWNGSGGVLYGADLVSHQACACCATARPVSDDGNAAQAASEALSRLAGELAPEVIIRSQYRSK